MFRHHIERWKRWARDVRAGVYQLSNAIADVAERQERLNRRLDRLESEVTGLGEGVSTKLAELRQDLSAEFVAGLDDRVGRLHEAQAGGQRKLGEALDDAMRLVSSQLQRGVDELRTGMIELGVPDLRAEVSELRGNVGALGTNLGQLKGSVAGIGATVGRVAASVGNLGTQTGQVKKGVGDLKKSVGETKKGVGDLKKRVGETKKGVGDLKKRVGEAKKGVGDVAGSVGDLKIGVGELRTTAGQLRASIGELRKGVGEFTVGTGKKFGEVKSMLGRIDEQAATAARSGPRLAKQLADQRLMQQERLYRAELQYQDLVWLSRPPDRTPIIDLETEHPVALDSPDHEFPYGTAVDNTRSLRFVRACERVLGSPLAVLDLGCSGGGLVFDFFLRGHDAFGLEGSDYSSRSERAYWRLIPNRLHSCDIAQPFVLRSPGSEQAKLFNLITAWEVLEHLTEEGLGTLFASVQRQLEPSGLFIGSVSCQEDVNAETGARYHQTVMPYLWWQELFTSSGFALVEDSGFEFHDFARGVHNSPIGDSSSYREDPDAGFHFVLRPAT